MNKGKATLTGAATGAAAGAALGPIGAGAGALIGGAIGFFASGDDDGGGGSSAPTYNPESKNFEYGIGHGIDAQGNLGGASDETKRLALANQQQAIAQAQAQLDALDPNDTSPAGQAIRRAAEGQLALAQAPLKFSGPAADTFAAQRTREIIGNQQDLRNVANLAAVRESPQQDMPDAVTQERSNGQDYLRWADKEGRQQQLNALGGLQQFADRAQGPSAAQAQLQAGTDMAAKQQFGFARAQPGGGGAALRTAAMNAAGISGNAANQAAALRAQEDASYRQQQLAALGALQQGAGAFRTGDQSFAQARAGQANYDANAANQFNQGQQQVQMGVGQNNLQASLQTQGANDALMMNALGQSQSYDAMRNNLAGAQQSGTQNYEGAKLQGAGLGSANFNAAQQQSNAETGMMLGALSGATGTIAQMSGNNNGGSHMGPTSDVRAKKNISRADVAKALGAAPSRRSFDLDALDAARASAPGGSMGTEYPKLPANTRVPVQAPNLRPAQGYTYDYKDPAQHGQGQFVGPMAQDLEHLPGVVQQGPDGTKSIDAPRLTLANTAAVSDQQKRLDELERKQRLMALGFKGGVMPGIDTNALSQVDQAQMAAVR